MDQLKNQPGTILEQGYGIIYKKVMRDPNLAIQAKAIYAYICSFAGAGDTAYPGAELICKELDINKDTYFKYLGQLKEAGYIEVSKQPQEYGRFAKNIYTIIYTPCPKPPDTVKSDTNNNSININSI